jgi:hypothetical protein
LSISSSNNLSSNDKCNQDEKSDDIASEEDSKTKNLDGLEINLKRCHEQSSNHCTCHCIFIMYSYIRIMFYFCMRDGGGDRGGSLAAARWQRQLGDGNCGSWAAAAWWQQLDGGSSSAVAVAAAVVAALQ